jgi:septin family protein
MKGVGWIGKMMNNNAKMEFWIRNNYNVLFIGKHGVGKTAMITQSFDNAKLRWRYFSASTMDPWVDFIGVPKEQKGED